MVWRQKVSDTFPRLKSDSKAEGWRKLRGKLPFVCKWHEALCNLPVCSDLSQPWKKLYWDLVVDSSSDLLMDHLGWSMEEVCSDWNWVPGLGFLHISEFLLTWQLALNVLPLFRLNYKAILADMPNCPRCGSSWEETTEHSFYYYERVHPFWNHIGEWMACIKPKQLMLLDSGYIVDYVFPRFQGEMYVVFLMILAVARMMILMLQWA